LALAVPVMSEAWLDLVRRGDGVDDHDCVLGLLRARRQQTCGLLLGRERERADHLARECRAGTNSERRKRGGLDARPAWRKRKRTPELRLCGDALTAPRRPRRRARIAACCRDELRDLRRD
jgi:hypothetical protein